MCTSPYNSFINVAPPLNHRIDYRWVWLEISENYCLRYKHIALLELDLVLRPFHIEDANCCVVFKSYIWNMWNKELFIKNWSLSFSTIYSSSHSRKLVKFRVSPSCVLIYNVSKLWHRGIPLRLFSTNERRGWYS